MVESLQFIARVVVDLIPWAMWLLVSLLYMNAELRRFIKRACTAEDELEKLQAKEVSDGVDKSERTAANKS